MRYNLCVQCQVIYWLVDCDLLFTAPALPVSTNVLAGAQRAPSENQTRAKRSFLFWAARVNSVPTHKKKKCWMFPLPQVKACNLIFNMQFDQSDMLPNWPETKSPLRGRQH